MDNHTSQESKVDIQICVQGANTQIPRDQREQPWKQLLAEIEKEARAAPVGEDFFPCKNGFSDHSLAA